MTQISVSQALMLISNHSKQKFDVAGQSVKVRINANDNEDDYEEIDLSQTKLCRKCRQIKTLDLFYANRSLFDGRSNHCKVCQAARQAAAYASNPEAQKLKVKLNREKNYDAYMTYQRSWRESKKLKQESMQ